MFDLAGGGFCDWSSGTLPSQIATASDFGTTGTGGPITASVVHVLGGGTGGAAFDDDETSAAIACLANSTPGLTG